jgi:hypothetical protein
MVEEVSKLRQALVRIHSHADDDHAGEVHDNILVIFDKLSNTEKTAVLTDVIKYYFDTDGNLKEDTKPLKSELEVMKISDKIAKLKMKTNIVKSLAVVSMVILFIFGGIAFLSSVKNQTLSDIISTFKETMSILINGS